MTEQFRGELYIGKKLIAVPRLVGDGYVTPAGNEYSGRVGTYVAQSCVVEPDGTVGEIIQHECKVKLPAMERRGIGADY